MDINEAYKIVENDKFIKRGNGTPGYFLSHYPMLTPEKALIAIELINCDIANTFFNWHCQCGIPECKWGQEGPK